MFDMLAGRLGKAVDALRGRGRLTEDNIADTLRQVRMALLEADVAVPVVKAFTDAARARAVGTEVMKSLTPGQAFIGVIHEELTRVMGEAGRGLNLHAAPPVVVLLAGLQGAGKTTTAAKLGRHLVEKHRRKVLLASTDVYRPAAMTQLERLAAQVGVDYFPAGTGDKPVAIAEAALEHARRHQHDVVIVDTAGRLHTQRELMAELEKVRRVITKLMPDAPHETLLTVDATTGQNGVRQAKLFGDAVDVTGIVLTKLDGTAKGGIALAIANELGIPVKLIGVGEQLEDLRPFDPDDFAKALLTA
jgi:signal recognition particle subunit SRP54